MTSPTPAAAVMPVPHARRAALPTVPWYGRAWAAFMALGCPALLYLLVVVVEFRLETACGWSAPDTIVCRGVARSMVRRRPVELTVSSPRGARVVTRPAGRGAAHSVALVDVAGGVHPLCASCSADLSTAQAVRARLARLVATPGAPPVELALGEHVSLFALAVLAFGVVIAAGLATYRGAVAWDPAARRLTVRERTLGMTFRAADFTVPPGATLALEPGPPGRTALRMHDGERAVDVVAAGRARGMRRVAPFVEAVNAELRAAPLPLR